MAKRRKKGAAARRSALEREILRARREHEADESNWQEKTLEGLEAGSLRDSLERYIARHAPQLGANWAAAMLGFRESLRGRKPLPVSWYHKVFCRYPPCGYVELCMGDHHHHWSGRFHRARRHYEKAAELEPELALAHYDCAQLYYLLGADSRVMDACQRAADCAREDEHQLKARALFDIASSLKALGKTAKAFDYTRQALAAWPEFPEANAVFEQQRSRWLV